MPFHFQKVFYFLEDIEIMVVNEFYFLELNILKQNILKWKRKLNNWKFH